MSERAIIDRLRQLFPRIGDDAAVVGNQVITTDMLVEGVDFTRAIPLPLIARKSLAVNLSDLAAMGARPSHAVVALATPEESDVEPFMTAIAEAAKQYGIEIVGGDLSRAPQLIVAITAIGIAERPLLRSGAKPGDRVYISRPLGASAVGLALMQRWSSIEPPESLGFAERELAQSAIRRHADPDPEVQLGIALAAIREVTSCIDVSDGLSTDLHHLCAASGVGAEIERQRIPVFADLPAHAAALGVNVRDAVLHGGEELALLFTASLREGDLSTRAGRPVYNIGRITEGRDVKVDGELFEARGWDHFA
jgi:thiamine-monophosphate kinase